VFGCIVEAVEEEDPLDDMSFYNSLWTVSTGKTFFKFKCKYFFVINYSITTIVIERKELSIR